MITVRKRFGRRM